MLRGTVEIKRIHFAFISFILVVYTCILSFLFFVLADRFYDTEGVKAQKTMTAAHGEEHLHNTAGNTGGNITTTGTEQSRASTVESKPYFVKLEDGQVKLFRNGEFEKNLEIDPLNLRRNDYASLVEGISVNTEEELLVLIEDFSS